MNFRGIFNFGKPTFDTKKGNKSITSSTFVSARPTDSNEKFSPSKVSSTVDAMIREDATISMIMSAYELSAAATVFRVESEDERAREFLEAVFFENPKWEFQTFLKMAMESIKYGFSVIEYTVESDGNLWTIGDIAKQGAVSEVVVDSQGVVSYQKKINNYEKERVTDNFIWLTREKQKGVYGESFLRSAYKSFSDAADISQVSILRHLKAGIGTPMLDTKDLLPEQVRQGEEALSSLRAAEISFISIPDAAKRITFLTPTVPDTKIIESLEEIRKTLASAFFCSFLIAGTTDNGSRAVADTQKAFFNRILDGLLTQVVAQINEQLVIPLSLENFGKKSWITFTPNDRSDSESVLTRLKEMKESGLITYGAEEENSVRGILGLKEIGRRENTISGLSVNPCSCGRDNGPSSKLNFSISDDKKNLIAAAVKRFNFKSLEKNIILSQELVSKLYENNIIPVLNDMLDKFEKQIVAGKRIYTKDYTKEWGELYTELNKVAKESFNVGKGVAADALGVDIPSTDSLVSENILAYVKSSSKGLIDDLALYGTTVVAQLELKSSDERNTLNQVREELQKRYDTAVAQATGNLPQLMLNAGQTYVYDKNGSKINGFIWRIDVENKLSGKICPFCLGMENLIVRPDDTILNTHKPPVHNNCACFWVPLRDTDAVLPEMYDEVPAGLQTSGVSNDFQFSLFAKKKESV